MTTLLLTFLLALLLSLALTPLAGRLGRRIGAVDQPGERKVHLVTTPRTGGLAVFAGLILALIAAKVWGTDVSRLLTLDWSMALFVAGGLIALGLGLYDDIRGLDAWRKLPVQILAASTAYLGGIVLDKFALLGMVVFFDPVTSYLLTVFWFLLFMNALNLMDGLDGLVGGIVFFASVVMVVLAIPREDHLTALFFAAMAGSVLGFLRSNFHPASIFLGDAGAYFLGYAIAGFGLLASVKSQVGAAILIPVLALGLPLLDTFLAALRRFIRGRNIFQSDSDHIHHRLLGMGLNTRRAVILLYALTAMLCILAIILVNIRDETSGLLLVLIGAGAFLFAGKLGYLNHIQPRNIGAWMQGICEEAGLIRERREVLHVLCALERAPDMETLRARLDQVVQLMGFDAHELRPAAQNLPEDAPLSPAFASRETTGSQPQTLFLQLPLMDSDLNNHGLLLLFKDMASGSLGPHILSRVELLRRSLTKALIRLNDAGMARNHVSLS